MWRLNVKLQQYEGCVKYVAHATKVFFNFKPGDILLLQITKKTCIDVHERTPCFMYFKEIVEDPSTVAKYWGNEFRDHKYLIRGERLKFIKPFTLSDIKLSNKIYDNQKNANTIHPEDRMIVEKLLEIKPNSSDDVLLGPEGDVVYKWHKQIERNSKNVKKIKKRFLKNYGKYFCEICKFEFQKGYGCEFIECHHKKPLSEMEKPQSPKIEDFALLCSNCHSIIHTKRPAMKYEDVVEMAKIEYIYAS